MALRRARSIDRIHELVADHDLVLTPDAPLALALNRRADGARLGDVASTPRNFAKQGLEVADRRELFHELARSTDLSFKQAATSLDLVLRCWEQTGEAEAILDHERHDRPAVREVLDIVQRVESAYTLREDVTVPADLDLAVVGPEGLSALDRRVLPDEDAFETIDPFGPGTFEMGKLDILPSMVAIAETIEAHITPANAGDVGIVLDPAGPIRPLIESTLDARSIPYHTEEGLAEHPGLRSFLRVLRSGFTRERLRGSDVRGLLVELGLPAGRRDDDKLVDRLSGASLEELRQLWEGLPEATLGEALDDFEALAGEIPRELAELADDLELSDAAVTRELVDALEFYLDTYRVERDYSREGVLLASGRDNAYVDRPLVFHLGLGADWAASVPADPWIGPRERKRLEERDLARFERLLQSGRRRVYVAQDTRRGKPVTPCFHLHELVDRDFERFAELPHRRRRPPTREEPPPEGFDAEEGVVDFEVATTETLSSGDVDRLSFCPRDWFMDQLVPEPERVWFRRGRIFHEFAELAAAEPDAVDVHDEAQLDRLVDHALEGLNDLIDPDQRPTQATELAVGFTNVADWLAENPPQGQIPAGYMDPPEDRSSTNRFAELMDVEIEPTRTERWFAQTAVGIHGMVDLVHGPDSLVDWKSTRSPDSLRKTIRRARVGEGSKPPRFQPAVYLLHHRQLRPGEPLELTFVDLLANRADAVRGEADVEDVTRRLLYRPCSFEEHVASQEAYHYATQSSKKRKDVFDEVGYQAYRSYVERVEVPPLEDKGEAETSDFADGLVELACRKRGNLKKSRTQARKAVGKLVSLKEHRLFAEDLDRLADHVEGLLEDLATWRTSRFPVPGDVDMDEVSHRDLILGDLDAHRARARRPGEEQDG